MTFDGYECELHFDGYDDGMEMYLCRTHDHFNIGRDFPCEKGLDAARKESA